jgi:hypothetical protein
MLQRRDAEKKMTCSSRLARTTQYFENYLILYSLFNDTFKSKLLPSYLFRFGLLDHAARKTQKKVQRPHQDVLAEN